MDKQAKKSERFRHFFQVLWAVITNSYLIGFVRGKIYQGKIKNICVPGMNCYSCPGAVAACPIGALQATIGSYEYKFAFGDFSYYYIIDRVPLTVRPLIDQYMVRSRMGYLGVEYLDGILIHPEAVKVLRIGQ